MPLDACSIARLRIASQPDERRLGSSRSNRGGYGKRLSRNRSGGAAIQPSLEGGGCLRQAWCSLGTGTSDGRRGTGRAVCGSQPCAWPSRSSVRELASSPWPVCRSDLPLSTRALSCSFPNCADNFDGGDEIRGRDKAFSPAATGDWT